MPRHTFGLKAIALVGRFCDVEHRPVPEIRYHLAGRNASVSEQIVTSLLDRYDKLLATASADDQRLKDVLAT